MREALHRDRRADRAHPGRPTARTAGRIEWRRGYPRRSQRSSEHSGHPEEDVEAGLPSGIGRGRERGLAIETVALDVIAIGGMARHDARGRRDASRVDLTDFFGVREDVAELAGEQVQLRVVELEMSQRGDGRDRV